MSSSSTLVVLVTRHATLGDRSFAAAAARLRHGSVYVAPFCGALKTYLFSWFFRQ